MAAALLLLITNLVGGGIGPQAVGIMSDYLAAQYNEDSLRYSLLAISLFFGLWSSLHYFLAGKTIRREFRKSLWAAQGFERTPKHEPVSLLRYAVTFKQCRWNMGLRVAGTGDRGLHVASSKVYQ